MNSNTGAHHMLRRRMKFKIKSRPEDFIVQEKAGLRFLKKAPYGVYLLEKRGWNTLDVLKDAAKLLCVGFEHFAWGGRKDRHAQTSQFITIPGPRKEDLIQKDYSLKFQGFIDRPMGPDLIEGNQFSIVVRDLNPEDSARARVAFSEVGEYGIPNYFDDQRFGSFDPLYGFLAEKLLKGHFNGALKIYLTAISGADGTQAKERKKIFVKHWKNWNACLKAARTPFERQSFETLLKGEKGFELMVKQIPRHEIATYFSAFESFIWNEVLRRLLSRMDIETVKTYPGVAGDYVFYAALPKTDKEYLRQLEIPSMAASTRMPDSLTVEIYDQVLKENGIQNSMFNKMKTRQYYFK